MGQGRIGEAEPLFHKALEAAVPTKSRLHGPILTDLADLECRSGRNEAGLAAWARRAPSSLRAIRMTLARGARG